MAARSAGLFERVGSKSDAHKVGVHVAAAAALTSLGIGAPNDDGFGDLGAGLAVFAQVAALLILLAPSGERPRETPATADVDAALRAFAARPRPVGETTFADAEADLVRVEAAAATYNAAQVRGRRFGAVVDLGDVFCEETAARLLRCATEVYRDARTARTAGGAPGAPLLEDVDWGLELLTVFHAPSTGTFGAVWWDPATRDVIVAFRGSATVGDFHTNGQYLSGVFFFFLARGKMNTDRTGTRWRPSTPPGAAPRPLATATTTGASSASTTPETRRPRRSGPRRPPSSQTRSRPPSRASR